MAKKIYVVAMADGTTAEFTSKKAIKALEGIEKVTINGEDITNEFVKEDEVMAENNITETIEAPAEEIVVEAIEPETEAPEEETAPEAPYFTLLFTASRGNNKKFNWYQIEVAPTDPTEKVKGCAAPLPTQVIEALGQDKFVSWMPQAQFEACVAEGRVVRGMASTVSDIYNRYIKVTEAKGTERVTTALAIFTEVLEAIKNGTTAGGWARPEPAPEEPKEENKEEGTEAA